MGDQIQSKMNQLGEKVNGAFTSEEGKQLLAKIGEIHQNMNLTPAEERKQLEDAFNAASPDLKNKIKDTGIFDKLQGLGEQNQTQ